MADKLTPKQENFVQGLFAGMSQREAYKKAGYDCSKMSDVVIDVRACELAKNSKIKVRLQSLQDEVKDRNIIKAEDVLQRWYDIATADPNEIMHLRRVCCRHCHGKGFQFQWRDEAEYQAAVDSITKIAESKGEEPVLPSNDGGYGFNKTVRPNPNCPYCFGEGSAELHVTDTRDLSPQAKLLYAGAKHTQAGIEIKLQDQSKALENVTRIMGMYKDNLDVNLKKKLEDFM